MKFSKALLTAFTCNAFTSATTAQQKRNLRNLSSSTECTVSTVHGMPLPGEDEIEPTYVCTTDEGKPLFFDEDPSPLIDPRSFEPGSTRFSIDPHAISTDGQISVSAAMAPGALAVSKIAGMNVSRNKGIKKVLVIIVKDSSGDAPSQDAAQMYDDVFADENNLAVRYSDCSNNEITMQPATGTGVVNGVLTVTTDTILSGISWGSCGTIATDNALGISRDHTFIVCPDSVDFGGAAAFGQMPGSVSWYKSQYASAPIVQMHELGHNLGHHHSGKNGVTYADPTCNMGNQGSWSDTGSNFCFNAAKTWSTEWYVNYHVTVDPTSTGFDGTIVGINAVSGNDIGTDEKVVMKIASSGETDLFLMYTRQVGALSSIPEDGNKIVIVSQASDFSTTSSWLAALSQGGTYTQAGWSGGAGTLTVEVCDLNATGTGSARVLVYETGTETKSCVTTSAPTASPVAVTSSPTSSPTVADPATDAPTGSPVADTPSPTSSPTVAVTDAPTGSPVADTPSPTSSPTASPTASPTSADGPSCEDTPGRHTFTHKKGFVKKNKPCQWLKNPKKCKQYTNGATLCPQTCGTCDSNGGGGDGSCEDVTTKVFISAIGKGKFCGWANAKKCSKFPELRENCKVSCNLC